MATCPSTKTVQQVSLFTIRPYSQQSGHPVTVGGGVGVGDGEGDGVGVGVGVGVVSVVPTLTHVALHPLASVTVTPIAQLPDAGAVQLITGVPFPLSIDPRSIVHE